MADVFESGDVVRRKIAPDQVGVVREKKWSDQLEEYLYRVQFGTATRNLPADDIELLPSDRSEWVDLLGDRCAGAEAFQRLLTFERLRRPPTRIAASFGSARARFFPYQFKPLLKFLENPLQRLLIADDVGLGKTIEAGYILRELKARMPVERSLFVVPARLRTKWKNELERRFDEPSEVVSAGDFRRRFLDPLDHGLEPPSFAWIISYESLRLPDITERMSVLQPHIDLVVVDEAHRVRNPDTQQHRAIRALATSADAMLFLTATPIQTGIENMFQLLRLLDPGSFADFASFCQQLEANRPVVRALGLLRAEKPALAQAADELARLRESPWSASLTESPFFESILTRLRTGALPDRATLVALQRDITELSLTANIISRTRKADVLRDRPTRRAQSVAVKLTPPERAFYDSVADLCRTLRPQTSSWGESMAALMAYRYTASCIPASLEYFRERLGGSFDLVADARSETEDEQGWLEHGVGSGSKDPGARLRAAIRPLVDGLTTGTVHDSKLGQFLAAVQNVWDDDEAGNRPRRKIIVFAFFKRTLKYLDRQLAQRGMACRLIHGDLPVPEREALIDEFLNRPDVLILLSSEVGSEGLDLQAASVVVNYDLPWNPMVVEQRIGRVDRIGQESPVVTVVNLVLANTVEQRILERLYVRIGLFTDTIGEIEPILGETIEKLVAAALRGELSPEEQAARTEQAAQAFLNEQLQARSVNAESDKLLAGDQAFLDEIEGLVGERRVPSPWELYTFVRSYIRARYPGSRVPESCIEAVGEVVLQPQVATDLLNILSADADTRRVAGRIGDGGFQATFDSDVFLKHPRSELISARHPLVRLAFEGMGLESARLHRAFRLTAPACEAVPAGYYLFAVHQLEIKGLRARNELRTLVWSLASRSLLDVQVSHRFLVHLLDEAADDEQQPPADQTALQAGRDALEMELDAVRRTLMETERDVGQARLQRRRATLETTLLSRIAAAERRLGALTEPTAPEFPVRMAQARLAQERKRLDNLRQEAAAPVDASLEDELVATGLVNIRPGRGRT